MQLNAGEICNVDPTEVGDIRDAVFVTDDVIVVGEAGVENAVETFSLANVALGWIWNAFFGEAVEAGSACQRHVCGRQGTLPGDILTGLPVLASAPIHHAAMQPIARTGRALGHW